LYIVSIDFGNKYTRMTKMLLDLSDLPAGQPEAFRFSGRSGLRRACGEVCTIHKRGEDKKVIKITDCGL